MKPLKILGLVSLALIAIYVVAIFVTPPTRYETRFEVDKPVDVTWRLFMDESRTKEWMDGLVSMETISGEPKTVGSKHRLVFDDDGRRIEMEEEVTSVVENKEFVIVLTHAIMDCEVAIKFEDLNGRTAIVTTNVVDGKGLMAPLFPFMKGQMVDRQNASYEKLAAIIEAE